MKRCTGSGRLILSEERVRAWGRERGLGLPCRAPCLLDVVQALVQVRMMPKVNGEIDVELSAKGMRGSCPSPFSRELAYIKMGVRACDTDLSEDMREN